MRYGHETCKTSDMIKTVTQYILLVLWFYLLFSYTRSDFLIHKISECKTALLENLKIILSSEQKIDKKCN